MFTFKPGYLGYFIFTTHIFTMIIAISPMLVVLDLNTVASVSGMHSVGLDVTASPGGGEAEGAITPRSMGLVSTTIAFNSVAFGSDQSYVPPHSAADSDKREDETA
ncbi:hypothetical protein FRB97_007836 [Tulasnella sp. 331]|nr:hypothetical protein FRB97_007836 [Tulasnella sp. 331]